MMHEYEIRFHPVHKNEEQVVLEVHYSDNAAIRSAKKAAEGRSFEVWRGGQCVFGNEYSKEVPR